MVDHLLRPSRWRWIALLLIAALLLAAPPGSWADAPPPPDGYQEVAANDQFRLYVDPTTLAFKVLDRRSGYLWHSGLDAVQEGDRLNRSWQAFARSGVSIVYLDARAVDTRTSLTNSEHTLALTPVDGGIRAEVTFVEYGISFAVVLQLEDDGVRVTVPFDSLREDNPAFRLGKILLYPFLGAARGADLPGYLVLPDGVGSLIHFAEATRARNMAVWRCYGPDLGMLGRQTTARRDPLAARINPALPPSLPIYGIVHEEGANAALAIIEDGAGYAELNVHPAGVITNYTFVHPSFIYNESYFQATNRSGAGVTTVQPRPNAFDAVVRYRFLAGDAADYVGIARSYQQYLTARGGLPAPEPAADAIGIRLEFLGGDREPLLAWSRFVPMTTLEQMRAILADLALPRPEVILYGWQPGGATAMPPTALHLDGALGGLDELRALVDAVAAQDGHVALYDDPQAAFRGEPGYSPRVDLAMAITSDTLEGYNRYFNYYFTIDALADRLRPLAEDIAARLPALGLALDGIGWNLYSDFRTRTDPFSREDAIDAYRALLADLPVRLGLYRPSDYLLSAARAYYDLPLSANGYIYTTQTVPLLPIVLSGYVPYYGTALNFSSDRQTDLLRHAEYGIYPSYFLTHEPTAAMLNTPSAWIYTSAYAQWGAEIRQTYDWLNARIGPAAGQAIVDHERLADGVFATTFASGWQIIVNYTDRPFERAGVRVGPRDAVGIEGGA